MFIPIGKMEKNMKKQFAKEERQIANVLYGKLQNFNIQI